jgi:methylmalonyl-CoA mutase N-terminal domain/subunit
VQEIAFTLANAIAYVEAAVHAGLDVDQFAGRLSFFFNSHNNLFEEVAKFRAARRLWATIMRDRFSASNPRSLMMRFHTQTAGCTLTAQQPENNVVRVTLQALSAVLGGTQSLHTNSRDEALSLPTEESARIALRTQQIIGHETGVTDTIDPLAGSYFVEQLTNRIEAQAVDYLQRIDDMGGALAAIERGFIQRQIQDSAYKYQRGVESKDQIIVGVNDHLVEEEAHLAILRVDPEVGERQKRKLQSLRQRRDSERVSQLLARLREEAGGSTNLMPTILECVEAYATLGEVCDALRDVFGECQLATIL